jgi:hypothetical protein
MMYRTAARTCRKRSGSSPLRPSRRSGHATSRGRAWEWVSKLPTPDICRAAQPGSVSEAAEGTAPAAAALTRGQAGPKSFGFRSGKYHRPPAKKPGARPQRRARVPFFIDCFLSNMRGSAGIHQQRVFRAFLRSPLTARLAHLWRGVRGRRFPIGAEEHRLDWYEARTSLSDKGIKPLMFGGARCQPHPLSLPAIRET